MSPPNCLAASSLMCMRVSISSAAGTGVIRRLDGIIYMRTRPAWGRHCKDLFMSPYEKLIKPVGCTARSRRSALGPVHRESAQSHAGGSWNTISDPDGKPEAVVEMREIDGEYVGDDSRAARSGFARRTACAAKCSGERRGQPIVGMEILRHMRPRRRRMEWRRDSRSRKSGKTYRAKMKLARRRSEARRCAAISASRFSADRKRGFDGITPATTARRGRAQAPAATVAIRPRLDALRRIQRIGRRGVPILLRRHGHDRSSASRPSAPRYRRRAIWYFLWAPVVDVKLRRRTWVLIVERRAPARAPRFALARDARRRYER